MADVGVVEGAAARVRAEQLREIAEGIVDMGTAEGRQVAAAADELLALVADREALLERIRELEDDLRLSLDQETAAHAQLQQLLGGSAAACTGGDHHWIDEPQIVCAHCGSFQ